MLIENMSIINEWEYEFYESIMRKKRVVSNTYKKLNINIKILNSYRKI